MSDFIYCLNTSTIRPTPLLEKIEVAGKAGYAAIEPWNDEITDYLEQGGQISELKRALAGSGLKVVSMIALHGWIPSEGAGTHAFSTNAAAAWLKRSSWEVLTSSPVRPRKSST